MKTSHLALGAILSGVPLGTLHANTGANVQCWAPGMGSQIVTITSYGQTLNVSFGRPFRYEIYGVAGRITLGNRMHTGRVDPNGYFSSNIRNSDVKDRVDSTTSLRLLVNNEHIYPRLISITGATPGVTYGPARLYGESWVTFEKSGFPDTTLGFRLAGTEAGDFVNRNPFGYFYVIGEYHPVPPNPTGEIGVLHDFVLQGMSTQVFYKILRVGAAQTVPPFADYDPNQEIIDGEAPPLPVLDGDPVPDGETQYPGATPIEMGENIGDGWTKIHNNRSGLGDATNPGRGSGRTNSPNEGTLNPGGLKQGLEPTP